MPSDSIFPLNVSSFISITLCPSTRLVSTHSPTIFFFNFFSSFFYKMEKKVRAWTHWINPLYNQSQVRTPISQALLIRKDRICDILSWIEIIKYQRFLTFHKTWQNETLSLALTTTSKFWYTDRKLYMVQRNPYSNTIIRAFNCRILKKINTAA